jgi:hypothetical protein
MTSPDAGRLRLSELPEAERSHPLFRRGYNLGYAHRVHEEELTDLQQRGPRPPGGKAATAPVTFDVTSGMLLNRLAPGVGVARDLTSHTDKDISTETPCCGRRITLPTPDEHQSRPAMCCRCRVTYQVSLVREEPDGYNDGEPPSVALFAVTHVGVAAARHRAGKWEPRSIIRGRNQP